MSDDLLREVRALGAYLGTDAERSWATFAGTFAPFFRTYCEYQIVPATGELGFLTFGRGGNYLNALEHQLRTHGHDEDARAVCASLRRFAPEATWGVKFPARDNPEAHVYVRRRIPLTEVLFWLRQRVTLAAGVAERIEGLAAVLEKTNVHFLCADFVVGQPARYHIYFTQYLADLEVVWGRLNRAVAALGMPAQFAEQTQRYFPLLAQRNTTLWVSVGVEGGELFPSFKLDYSDVRLGTVGVLLEDVGLTPNQCDRPRRAGELVGLGAANYLGVRLLPERPPLVSIYLTARRPGAVEPARQEVAVS